MTPYVYYELKHEADSNQFLHHKTENNYPVLKQRKEDSKQQWAFLPIEDDPAPEFPAYGQTNEDVYGDDPLRLYHFYIKRKDTGKYLSKVNSDDNDGNSLKLKGLDETDDRQRWRLHYNSTDESIILVCKANGKALHANNSEEPEVFLKNIDINAPNQRWTPIFAVSRWDMTTKSFDYDDTIPVETTTVDIVLEMEIRNQSSATFTKTISNSKTKSSSFEWGFNESLSLGQTTTVSANADIPKLGGVGASVERSVEFTFEANQKTIEAKEETYEIEFIVEVPPFKSVKVSGSFDWLNNAEFPFTAHFLLKAWADAETSSGTWQLSSDDIKKVLQSSPEYSEEVIIEDQNSPNQVEIRLTGTFIGNYGASSRISIEEISESGDVSTEDLTH